MSEIVITYKTDNFDESIPMDRAEFYDEQIKIFAETGKTTRAVEVIQVLLFSPDGEIMLQKRSNTKKHNPGVMDKTIGGHMRWGDTPFYTVMYEALQELSVPSFVLPTEEDFNKTYNLLRDQVNSAAFIQYIDSKTYNSKKIIDGEEVQIGNKYHLFFGVYSGAIKPHDKEVAGVLFYDYQNLLKEMKEAPQLFASDLHFFLKKYREDIDNFLLKLK